jgi:hypothetical protein
MCSVFLSEDTNILYKEVPLRYDYNTIIGKSQISIMVLSAYIRERYWIYMNELQEDVKYLSVLQI